MPEPQPYKIAEAGTEDAHQIALFCWAALPDIRLRFPELQHMFHIPNGGLRNKAEAGKFKAMGVKAGVPDIFLPVPRWGKAGLWIELKVGSNKPSPDQIAYHAALYANNFDVTVQWTWDAAADYIMGYLSGSKGEI